MAQPTTEDGQMTEKKVKVNGLDLTMRSMMEIGIPTRSVLSSLFGLILV